MDASILIVGSREFCDVLVQFVQAVANLTVETAANAADAIPFVQAQQPDVLILQSDQDESFELCRLIRSQNRLAWIYCILVGNPAFLSTEAPSQLEQATAFALNVGADAFLPFSIKELLVLDRADPTKGAIAYQQLLHAQIGAGLRRVQTDRELIRANDLLSAIALSDPLTELNNRRAFEWELPRQIFNARSRSVPISLLMLDIDFFKCINDNYGHLVGDRALKLVAARLRHNLRFYDTPFRYGGEEFAVILNNTNAGEAGRIGYRICRLIASQPFAIDESLELTITISAGSASLRDDDDERGISFLRRADQNLLKAKSQGRNQIVASED
ncbi:MAG: diguanylate cyclase [Synechococcales bacterium]|nr:diguanylate cyclase [Synechococcales bacterium]